MRSKATAHCTITEKNDDKKLKTKKEKSQKYRKQSGNRGVSCNLKSIKNSSDVVSTKFGLKKHQ